MWSAKHPKPKATIYIYKTLTTLKLCNPIYVITVMRSAKHPKPKAAIYIRL